MLQALVGHQYGTASLPAQVEVSEYQLLLQESQQAGVSTQELERAYQRDENSIPPSYCLRPAHTNACSAQVISTLQPLLQSPFRFNYDSNYMVYVVMVYIVMT